jgi:hypothetical protein
MTEIPGQSGHALPTLQLPVCANSRRAVLPLLEEPCPSNLGRRPLVDFGKNSVEASQTAKA